MASIKKGLSDSCNIGELINLYSCGDIEEFIEKLKQKRNGEKERYDLFQKNKDDFYNYIFIIWRNDICKSFNNLNCRNLNNNLKDDISVISNILKSNPNITSFDELQTFCDEKPDFSMFSVSKNSPTRLMYDGWEHVFSQTVLPGSERHIDLNSFISLSATKYDIYFICRKFTEKCLKRGLLFHYKFNVSDNINDNIIIYGNKEQISKYLEVLDEIKKEFPFLISRCGKPSIILDEIDGYIGYGNSNSSTCTTDYYEVIGKKIFADLDDYTFNYLKKYTNEKLSSKIKNFFSDSREKADTSFIIGYLAERVADEFVKYHANKGSDYVSNSFKMNIKDFCDISFKKFLAKECIEQELKKQLFDKDNSSFSDVKYSYQFRNYELSGTISKKLVTIAMRKSAPEIYNNSSILYRNLINYLINSYYINNYLEESNVFSDDKGSNTMLPDDINNNQFVLSYKK